MTSETVEATVYAFDTPVRVFTSAVKGGPALLRELLAPGGDAASLTVRSAVTAEGVPTVNLPSPERADFERIAYRFTVQVTTAALVRHRGKSPMFHAGGIAKSDGAVAAIIGPSGRGKTTTVSNSPSTTATSAMR